MTPERYARIKALFAKATELDQGQHAAFLDRECHDDAELKSEVEALLEHDDSQTIISAQDTTIADFSPETVAAPSRRSLSSRLRGLRNLTKHLGPRGHLAIGALMSCVVLALLGYIGNYNVLQFQKELRREALNEIVDGKVLALEMWLEHETGKVESWARSNKLRGHIGELVKLANESAELPADFEQAPVQQSICEELDTLAGHEVFFSIWDRRHLLIADTLTEVDRIGDSATPWGAGVLAIVFEGRSQLITLDQHNAITHFNTSIRVAPHLGIVTPIRGDHGQVIAALLVHDNDSPQNASRILSMIRLGESGETYTFNQDGLMLSESRFDEQLRDVGLIPDNPESMSNREIYLRDPGGDLTAGYEPDEPLSARPLTKMARLCTAGHDGDDLDGYRDYRGVEVVGAWRWLEEHRELIDRDSTARFEREARLVSQLEHPNTIRVYDYGVTPEGLFFYVMEYIDGLSLGELVDLEPALPPARVILLLKQICYSLREAHEAELVHRDLKPANIMVCQRGGEPDVVKVLDFGLVKHIDTATAQKITSTAMVAGTPQYIAPERLSNPETNDPRSDIYSLGAVTFFLLTGRDFVQGGSLAGVLYQIVNASPVCPSECTDTNIPEQLDQLVYRCLAKDPQHRPSSVSEMITVLDSIELAIPWTVSDAKSWWDSYARRFRKGI